MNECTIIVDSYYGGSVKFRRQGDYSYEPRTNSIDFALRDDGSIDIRVNGRWVASVPVKMTGESALVVVEGTL